ncbi:MAG: hypothetical protein ABIP97_09035 [Chthoniobacterales bacterium]
MKKARKNVRDLRVSFNAHAALHCLQGLAMDMPDKYEAVSFPFYGGSSRMGTLFLTRKMPKSKFAGCIQQTSDTTMEASLIGRNPDEDASVNDLLKPLIKAYQVHYPTLHITPE